MKIGTGIFNLTGNRSLTVPILVLLVIIIFLVIPLFLAAVAIVAPDAIRTGCASTYWKHVLENSSIMYQMPWGWLILAVSLAIVGWAINKCLYLLPLSDLPSIFVWLLMALPFLSLIAYTFDWSQLHTNKMVYLRSPANYDPLLKSNRNQLSTALQESGIFVASKSEPLELVKRASFRDVALLDRFEEGPSTLFSPRSKRPFTDVCKESMDLELAALDENGLTVRRSLSLSVFTPLEERDIWSAKIPALQPHASKILDVLSIQSAALGPSLFIWTWLKIFIIQCAPVLLFLISLVLYDKNILKLKRI